MQIINESNFRLDKLIRLIRFCRPPSVFISRIIFRNSKKPFYGYFLKNSGDIVIGIGPCSFYPLMIERENSAIKQGYETDFWIKSKEEAVILLLSHELRHLQQRTNPRLPRMGKCKNLYSESDADLFALKKIASWRKKKNYEKSNRARESS